MNWMPRQDTKPELALRRELHRKGLRHRLRRTDLPGRPDISFASARVVVRVREYEDPSRAANRVEMLVRVRPPD